MDSTGPRSVELSRQEIMAQEVAQILEVRGIAPIVMESNDMRATCMEIALWAMRCEEMAGNRAINEFQEQLAKQTRELQDQLAQAEKTVAHLDKQLQAHLAAQAPQRG